MYAGLKLPRRAWLGLTRLPEVGGISDQQRPHYMALVGNHMKVWTRQAASRNPCTTLGQPF